jgi:hypothetical protein
MEVNAHARVHLMILLMAVLNTNNFLLHPNENMKLGTNSSYRYVCNNFKLIKIKLHVSWWEERCETRGRPVGANWCLRGPRIQS